MATTDSPSSKPANTINTPAFVDTDSCDCRLRSVSSKAAIHSEHTQVWHCIGHDTTSPLPGCSEKWYLQISGENGVKSRGAEEASNFLLPDTRTWYSATVADGQPLQLRPFDSHELDLPKGRCTGEFRDQENTVIKNARPLLIQRGVRIPRDDESLTDNTISTSADQEPSDITTPGNEEIPTDEETSSGEDIPSEVDLPDDDEQLPTEDVNSAEYKYLHSCLGGDGAVAVQMQNDSSWNDVGCLPGFLCK
ncbi:MAG: hypothetical protein Q9178_001456 [Gyalolechia marmorata]